MSIPSKPTDRTSFEKSLVGPAGEHYVMYQVHRRGRMAALAPRNFPHADIMIVSPDGAKSALVQVKTRTRGRDGGWHMSEKHERIDFPDLFYCFVDFQPNDPVAYVIPSTRVAQVIRDAHRVWLALSAKDGTPHEDNKMRRVLPCFAFAVATAPDGWMDEWRDRWDLLIGG
jgi:hypothetical protein